MANNLLILTLVFPCRSVAQALEVIPRTLIQNCGANVIRTLTKLRVCAGELFG
jgi:chaperonin GroEL (HSP60 family)